eukprot:403371283
MKRVKNDAILRRFAENDNAWFDKNEELMIDDCESSMESFQSQVQYENNYNFQNQKQNNIGNTLDPHSRQMGQYFRQDLNHENKNTMNTSQINRNKQSIDYKTLREQKIQERRDRHEKNNFIAIQTEHTTQMDYQQFGSQKGQVSRRSITKIQILQ